MKKLVRVIEEFKNEDDKLHKEYILNISTKEILEVLDDLILNQDDYLYEIFDPYNLITLQFHKLIG